MFVFPCCLFVLPSCKIVSEVVHTNRQRVGTEFAFIILLAFVNAGMVNGEHSEAILFNALYGRAVLQQLVSHCTCGLHFALRMNVRKCFMENWTLMFLIFVERIYVEVRLGMIYITDMHCVLASTCISNVIYAQQLAARIYCVKRLYE